MEKILIIAEAGVNHNGSLDLAFQLIDAAVEAGADIIKFQSFKADKIVTQSVHKAEYQKKHCTDSSNTQYEMLKKLEISEQDHYKLSEYCKKNSIQFLSTPFDSESLNFLTDKLRMNLIKIASGEITNYPFLFEISQKKLPLIISTGMTNIGEIELALGVIAFGLLGIQFTPNKTQFLSALYSTDGQEILKKHVTLLHCTSEYPAPFTEVNLKAIDTLNAVFGLKVGFSDHTKGISIPIAAAARGAQVIEKHFTLDRNLEGPDHKASLEPKELKRMIDSIREVELALGNGRKIPTPSEFKNQNIVRKVLVAANFINKDEIFNEKNITIKRSGNGLEPIEYWNILGKKSAKDFSKDEAITFE